jgi:glucans biosynthesis protein C
MTQNEESERVYFLDNVRSLLVLLVVVLHATFAYSKFVPWWCVKDLSGNSAIFDIFLFLLDIFLMPSLFFIAGYFATPSYVKNGASAFLSKKFKRLCLPLLIAIPIISPTFAYIYSYKNVEISPAAFWVNYMAGAFEFDIKIMNWTSHFNQAHLWFLSLLLFFFVIYVATIKLKVSLTKNNTYSRNAAKALSPIILFVSVVFLSALSTGVANIIFPKNLGYSPWVSVGNVLIFDPSRIVSYFLYFGVGIYAFKNKWFSNIKILGSLMLWIALCFIFSICSVYMLTVIMTKPSLVVFVLFLVSKSLLCISCLLTILLFSHRYWNIYSRFNQTLAENSYNIYVLHFVFIIVLQLLLKDAIEGGQFIKFFIVSITTIISSFTLSQYGLRLFPRITIIGIYASFVTLMIVGQNF